MSTRDIEYKPGDPVYALQLHDLDGTCAVSTRDGDWWVDWDRVQSISDTPDGDMVAVVLARMLLAGRGRLPEFMLDEINAKALTVISAPLASAEDAPRA